MIGTVTGTVDKVITGNFNGVGIVVLETFTGRDGEPREKKTVAWFDEDPGVQPGSAIKVSGSVSAKVDTWTGNDGVERTTAKLQLNNARLDQNAPSIKPKPAVLEDAPF